MSTPLSTVKNHVKMALNMMKDLTGSAGDNVYLGIGHSYPWTANDLLIDQPVETTDYLNQVHRDLAALKKLSISNASLVVRREDWTANTIYDPFTENDQMYSMIQVVTGVGTINVANSTAIVGKNTAFLTGVLVGDLLTLPGDGITLLPQTREIISIANDTILTVNSAYTGNFISNSYTTEVSTAPHYVKKFYVRNTYDQVFVCLDNFYGSASSQMPTIGLGGQLPNNPYILTTDGYKWKYLYTMSGGQKQLFLTTDWMPVTTDSVVTGAAVDGRIDIVVIVAPGQGYNGNVASFNAPIIVVTGDGTGANLTAQVDANGSISGINILSGGTGYTSANITANTGATGANANLVAILGPRGGWGSNSAFELGASTLMISTTLTDTESGTIPVVDILGEYFAYRQLSLIVNPTLIIGGAVASNTNYDLTTAIQISSTPGFRMNDWAYQSPVSGLLQDATFRGRVVWYDSSTSELHLNNVVGNFVGQTPIYGATSTNDLQNNAPYVTATAFSLVEPAVKPQSGVDLYIENVPAITRFPLQAEEIRLILSF